MGHQTRSQFAHMPRSLHSSMLAFDGSPGVVTRGGGFALGCCLATCARDDAIITAYLLCSRECRCTLSELTGSTQPQSFDPRLCINVFTSERKPTRHTAPAVAFLVGNSTQCTCVPRPPIAHIKIETPDRSVDPRVILSFHPTGLRAASKKIMTENNNRLGGRGDECNNNKCTRRVQVCCSDVYIVWSQCTLHGCGRVLFIYSRERAMKR